MFKTEHIQICGGITLHYMKTDKFKTDSLTFLFSSMLDKKLCSYRTLLISVLMSGCEKYPGIREINDVTNELYGADFSSLNTKRGDFQQTGATLKYLAGGYTQEGKSLLSDAADLMYNVIFRPLLKDGAFDREITEIEKKNLVDSIRADINNKTVYARKKCISLMCGDELYGVNTDGDEAVVAGISADELYDFYKAYTASSPLDVYYVGGEDRETVTSVLSDKLSSCEIVPTELVHTEVVRKAREVKEYTEKMPVTQGKLSIGFRTGVLRKEKDYAALCVCNAVYGLTPTSKLFANVREKLSLCYYCRSQLIETKGIMLVSSGIECVNKAKALDEILAQLEDVKNGKFTGTELSLAKKYCVNSLKSGFDSAGAAVIWCAAELYDGTDKTTEDFIEEIGGVTADDVVRVAKGITEDTVYYLEGTGEEN